MIFNSFEFFFFFAITAILFGIVKQQHRQWVLLIFSVGFFLSFGIKGLFYLLFTTATTFFCAIAIEKLASNKNQNQATKLHKNIVLALGLVLNLGILVAVKYFNFLFGGIVGLFNGSFNAISFFIPLGISFYTFQMMGYLIDVYRQMAVAQKNFFRMLLFAGYFPQMIDGPISRYGDICDSLYSPPPIEYTRCRNALVLFTWGLFKKICVADNLKFYVDIIFKNYDSYHGIMILSGAVAYAIYLYADFGGCIDMARGISAYFGINLKNNFERPYFSTSVEEFWRRWHITLSTWFRDYLFYPLQRTTCFKNLGKKLKNKGYKKAAKAIPAILALLVVWLTTGLWHGANLTYVAWGLYYGMFMVFGVLWNTYRKKGTKKEPSGIKGNILTVLKIAKTFFIVCVGYILFNSATLSDAFGMLANMFDLTRLIVPSEIFYAGVRFYKEVGAALYFTITVVCTLILIAYDLLEEREISVSGWLQKQNKVVKYCLSAITVLILLFLMGRSSGDFTYMQF